MTFSWCRILSHQDPWDQGRPGPLREDEETVLFILMATPGDPTGLSSAVFGPAMAIVRRHGAPLATHLRDTDKILSISILRFSTSFTWPLSGPCLTFSRPIRYKHFGVRIKSRFMPWKERRFQKGDRHARVTAVHRVGTYYPMKGSCLG